jgi:hypothetical protein
VALLRPCATSAGFTATPEQPRKVDMGRLRAGLAAAGYRIVVDARIILVVREPGDAAVESSLYDNGRVLLKTTDRAAAERAYAALEPHLAGAAGPPPNQRL